MMYMTVNNDNNACTIKKVYNNKIIIIIIYTLIKRRNYVNIFYTEKYKYLKVDFHLIIYVAITMNVVVVTCCFNFKFH